MVPVGLSELVESARERWPAIAIGTEPFVAHLVAKLGDRPPQEAPAADLYLACACGLGDIAAIAALEEHYLRPLTGKLARARIPAPVVDDVLQILRVRLLVSHDGERPRILDFAGTGDLHGWLRVAAMREAVGLMRTGPMTPLEDELAAKLPSPVRDPADENLKESYRAVFRTALAGALAALSPRERNLLRQRYLDDLSIDQLAKFYRVHRATAARWANAASTRLLTETRRRMAKQLGIARAELGGILRFIQSRFDVSVRRLFDELRN